MTIGGTITATDASAIKYTCSNDVAWTFISDIESKIFTSPVKKYTLLSVRRIIYMQCVQCADQDFFS